MAVPSKNFTIIADSAIDADSPITADLMTDFRDNDIHLEEWLGLSYTAAQDHNHDGTNSAPVDISGILTAYNAQDSENVSGSSWNIDTGSLGFTPQAMILHWGLTYNNKIYQGWGMGMGTDAGDQHGMSNVWDVSGTPVLDNVSVDSNDIMGYSIDTGGSFLTSFGSERARIDQWGSDNVEIQTQTGAWVNSTCYFNLQIWGA